MTEQFASSVVFLTKYFGGGGYLKILHLRSCFACQIELL